MEEKHVRRLLHAVVLWCIMATISIPFIMLFKSQGWIPGQKEYAVIYGAMAAIALMIARTG